MRTYLPGLNSLRTYAAFAVIFSHIDQNVSPSPLFIRILRYFFIDASSAVSLFFVLSGFLITYLLLHELSLTGYVSIRKFYARRVLRIWPLYYAVAIIGFLIFPFIFGSGYVVSVFYPDYPTITLSINAKLLLVFCFLPNFATVSAPMEHLWSIGVEEQFYAFWPWVVRNKSIIVRICIGVLIIKFISAPIISLMHSNGISRIFNEFRYECMAIGALGAYVYHEKHAWLKWIYHPVTQILAGLLFAFMALRDISVNAYFSTGISIVFITIILNIATNINSLVKLTHPLLDHMGQISYGLYLWHFPVLYVFLLIISHFNFLDRISFYPTSVFIGVIGGTWLMAEISYRWFEGPILKLKEQYAVITKI